MLCSNNYFSLKPTNKQWLFSTIVCCGDGICLDLNGVWLELEEQEEPHVRQELQRPHVLQELQEPQVLWVLSEELEEPQVEEALVKMLRLFVLKPAYPMESEVDGSERRTAVTMSELQVQRESPFSPFWHSLLLLIPC